MQNLVLTSAVVALYDHSVHDTFMDISLLPCGSNALPSTDLKYFSNSYWQLRTKEQFGYQVSCGARWTAGVIGMSFRVVSAAKNATEITSRIDRFLLEYRKELANMSKDTFTEHVVGLAKIKLQMHNSLDEETAALWYECTIDRHEWEVHRNEAFCLREITLDDLLSCYDEYFYPGGANAENERRRITIQVIGTGKDSSDGRPAIDSAEVDEEVDKMIASFHKSTGEAVWK